MKIDGKSDRIRKRLELSLPARVQGRESKEYEWVEMSRLLDVTPFGARLTIARPTEPGRLLLLTLPMPRQLRCYDHVEQQYRVWALVRSVKLHSETNSSTGITPRYEIGVAFIGKRPPPSYHIDPTRRYEVASNVTEAGFWDLREAEERAASHVPSSDPRPETRHYIPIEVIVEAINEEGKVFASETTVTENISRRGAAVFTTLEMARGSFVRVTSSQYGISVTAAVRARRKGPDGITRMHLEFVDQQWPLEGA